MKRLALALLDREKQRPLFKEKTEITAAEKESLSKVERFVQRAGRLVSFVTPDDLATLETVAKSNAQACAAQLALLERLCRDLKDTLLANAAKQDLR